MAIPRPHLSKAPIAEAVIDIQIQPEGVRLEDIKAFADRAKGYERIAPMFHVETAWAVRADEGPRIVRNLERSVFDFIQPTRSTCSSRVHKD